jgi:hypothetical protein
MKNPLDVLRAKEAQIVQVKAEIDALRVVAKLLADDDSSNGKAQVELRQVVPMP